MIIPSMTATLVMLFLRLLTFVLAFVAVITLFRSFKNKALRMRFIVLLLVTGATIVVSEIFLHYIDLGTQPTIHETCTTEPTTGKQICEQIIP